jgi:hypothetical protein
VQLAFGIELKSQATVNSNGAAKGQKDEGVDNRREERPEEHLLDHEDTAVGEGTDTHRNEEQECVRNWGRP